MNSEKSHISNKPLINVADCIHRVDELLGDDFTSVLEQISPKNNNTPQLDLCANVGGPDLFNTLSDTLVLHIFSYLSTEDLCNVQRTCSRFGSFCFADIFVREVSHVW